MQNNNIKTIIESFFLCTHIPIQAISYEGTMLVSTGLTEDFNKLFHEHEILKTLKHNLEENKKNTFATAYSLPNINFTACYICSNNKHKGLFIFGPYSSANPVTMEGLLYKPDFCIPHITSLLLDLRNSACAMKKEKELLSIPSYNSYIKDAIEFIHDNFHKPITLDDIASHIKINKCYFCNLFKRETGTTCSEFLNHVRIEKSKELLFDRSLSVLEVSLSAGFNNQNYFNTVFKRLTNMTPMEYRNSF